MWELCVYEYITLHCNVMLRAFVNFRRVWFHIVSDRDDEPAAPLYRDFFTTELKPAYGTHVSEFGGPATVQCKIS
jgi:hypothetical protein